MRSQDLMVLKDFLETVEFRISTKLVILSGYIKKLIYEYSSN
jgi:hypothetical protein